MTLKRIREICQNAASDCEQVQDAWESGDLAGSVRSLTDTIYYLRCVETAIRRGEIEEEKQS